jgi:predicted aspartyl protease
MWPGARYLLIATLLVAVSIRCVAGETQLKPSLENYLKGIGYEPIPLNRNEQNDLVARAELHGKQRSLVVDTGWSLTTLDKGVARKLKTLGELNLKLEDSFLGTITNPAIVLMDLKLGRAVFTNQPARVESLQFGGRWVGDGVLGCDFLFRNYCLIDCLSRRLYVRGAAPPLEIRNALEESLRRSGYHEVDLSREFNLVLTFEAKANDQPLRLLVDTGAVYSLLDDGQVKRLGLRPRAKPMKVVGVGKIGSQWLDVARLKSLQLGDLMRSDIDFGVADLRNWGVSEPGREMHDVHGILGADQLMLNGALIDCHRLKLWLQPLKSAR